MSARQLFGTSVYFESGGQVHGLGAVKTCGGDCGCGGKCGGAALHGLGNTDVDMAAQFYGSIQNLIDGITGAKSNREAQEKQLLLAKAQVAANQAEAEARNATLTKVLPVALAVGGAIVALGIVGLILKKRGG